MSFINSLKKFWVFLKQDTWQSWIVSLVLAFLIIKFIFFPALSFVTASELPLVVVESCSMYHEDDFDGWWESNDVWYEDREISKEDFENFPFKNGLNKGDIVLVSGRGGFDVGDIIIFNSNLRFPLIHRVVELNPVETKGDKNLDQLDVEKNIDERDVLGKSVARVPGLGWVKLIFFEGTKPPSQRGFCK